MKGRKLEKGRRKKRKDRGRMDKINTEYEGKNEGSVARWRSRKREEMKE